MIETGFFWQGLHSGFEKSTVDLWLKLCKRSQVIVDIGANTGIYSLLAKAVQPESCVMAFEPIPRVFRTLLANNSLNKWNIEAMEIALSNYNGVGTMYDLPHEHVYCVMLNTNLHKTPAVPIQVQVKRLDTIVVEKGLSQLDLIKIDVESHEPEVLEGMGELLVNMKPTLVVEIWNDEIGRKVENFFQCTDYLFYHLDDDRGPKKIDHIRNAGPSYANYGICVPKIANDLDLPRN